MPVAGRAAVVGTTEVLGAGAYVGSGAPSRVVAEPPQPTSTVAAATGVASQRSRDIGRGLYAVEGSTERSGVPRDSECDVYMTAAPGYVVPQRAAWKG